MDAVAWLAVAYIVKSRLVLFLAVAGVVAWFGAEVGYSWGAYWLYLGRPFHFIGLGACMLTLAGVHAWRNDRGFAGVWALGGLLVVYLSTLILSIFDIQKHVRVDSSTAPAMVWLLLAGPYAIAITLL